MNKLKVFETFAGYGGAHYGLKRTKVDFEVIGISEVDKHAVELYNKNFPNIKNFGDITKIQTEELPDFNLFTGGFPCQPFSTAGLGLGELDMRGTLFYDIIRIVTTKKPEFVLLENVKGFLSKKHRPTLHKIISEFENLGYKIFVELLNTKDFGIPQNRERVWIFATLNSNFDFTYKISPQKENLTFRVKDFVDKNVDENLYKTKKQIDRLIELHNVDFNINETLCFDVYNKKIKTDGICPTITEPHHNSLRIVEPPQNGEYKVRKLSVSEQFRLMGFKENEVDFANQSYTQLGNRCGNGWDVNLVGKIFSKIFKQAGF
ncbi:DNA cytosine methyltransferase [Bacteroidota bacterium]|nr:DNA cytosine methyltransferase [Bacteroidota bacterium]